MMPSRLGILAAALAGAASFSSASVAEDTAAHREDRLKAAYFFNFVKFVEWPASVPADLFTVCFVGAEGVHDALALGLENKRVGARRLAVRQLKDASNAAGCNALYMDAQASASPDVAPATQGVLTVSDSKGFARNGGMIEVFTDKNRLQFNVNVDAAHRAGLRISSSLLQLAATVEKGSTK